MRYKIILLLIASVLAGSRVAQAQSTTGATKTVNDTVFNPKIVFSANPQRYEIAGISVEGVDNYEDYIIIGYSGLSVGQRIEIPGDDLKAAAKRFWRQGLFNKVQILVSKIYKDKAWLVFNLRQQPRISKINYVGVKSGERKDLQEKLGLQPGNQITPNIASRIEQIVKQHFAAKGFEKATCNVRQSEDLSKQTSALGIRIARPL